MMGLGRTASVAALVLAGFAVAAEARTITVDCAAGQKIGPRLFFALPGDTLRVSGVCNERVVLEEHKVGLTLDGQGTAEIVSPDATQNAVIIRARGTVLRGFRITGGRHGVSVQDGGQAVIDGNVVELNQEDGIHVGDSSSADIVNNTVRGNGSDGITITDNSSARIGFRSTQDAAPSPNVIDANGRGGVTVNRSANARIAGNSFTGNADYAVRLVRGAQADVAGNAMNDNLGGIQITQNSTATLTDVGDGAAAFLSARNTGVNREFGVLCLQAGFMRGVIAPLTGALARLSQDASCVTSQIGPLAP
jgi:parallel beta-helix repeat protein